VSLLPSTPDVSADGEPRVVGVDSEDADELLAALSSATARRIVAALHDEPAPPSKVAEEVDSSLQNVQYHLGRLEDAGVVEVAGTAYSEKGREMDVYAPADQPLVIVAAEEEQTTGLKAALSRLLGGVAALLVGSAAVQEVFGDGLLPSVGMMGSAPASGGGGGDGAGAGDPTATPTEGDGGGIGIAENTPTPTAEGTPTAATGTETEAATATQTTTATETPAATGTPDPIGTPTATAEPTGTPLATDTATPTEMARTAAETATPIASGGGDAVGTLPPGALFFLGGFVVLVAAVALSVR
jgi:DNA-binding transcriptional ArsR family regulator